jgi:hypothetical protein
MPVHKPKSFHIDKRAATIAASGDGAADELLTPREVAEWFGVSPAWLALTRDRGDGPPYERITPTIIRYRRDKVLAWLDARSHRSTREYRGGRKAEAVA